MKHLQSTRQVASATVPEVDLHDILRGSLSVSGDLPLDAKLKSVYHTEPYQSYTLIFSSQKFDDVPQGTAIPSVDYELQSVVPTDTGKREADNPSCTRRVVLSSHIATMLFNKDESYASGLPKDATVVEYYTDETTDEHTFIFESSKFGEVPEGDLIPFLDVNVFPVKESSGGQE